MKTYFLDKELITALMEKYGTRYQDVLALTHKRPILRERVCEDPPTIEAQIVYAAQVEMAQTAEDILERRLGLIYLGDIPKKCLEAIERVL